MTTDIEQRQLAFDKALFGVRKQGKISTDNSGKCYYRNADGTAACGIGHLIPDELYMPTFDRQDKAAVADLLSDPYLPEFRAAIKAGGVNPAAVGVGVSFLTDLQASHDAAKWFSEGLEGFERNMQELATRYELKFTEKV